MEARCVAKIRYLETIVETIAPWLRYDQNIYTKTQLHDTIQSQQEQISSDNKGGTHNEENRKNRRDRERDP